jgi:hypothetical protein
MTSVNKIDKGISNNKKALSLFLPILVIMFGILVGCGPVIELETCVFREPVFKQTKMGFELIDLWKKEVWATSEYTEEEFAAFSPPLFWRKNEPREPMFDRAKFHKSPGCDKKGQFTYMRAFGKKFLKVVQLIDINAPVDGQGVIRKIELEKYHLLSYSTGRRVYVLHSPTGERYIGVARSADRTSDTFTIPQGWKLTNHELKEELQVELSGTVSNIRTDNEDSYQGPIPDDLRFSNH